MTKTAKKSSKSNAKSAPAKKGAATDPVNAAITRARALEPAARLGFFESMPKPELRGVYERITGLKTSGRATPETLSMKIVEALGSSVPLEKALDENQAGAANESSWEAAMPEAGYEPPAGEDGDDDDHADDGAEGGDGADADDDARANDAPATDAATTATDAAQDAPAGDAATAPVPSPAGTDTGATGANDAPATTRKAKEPKAPADRDPRLPAVGTVLVKADRHGAERVRCTLVEGGVEYAGTIHKSLSAAAVAASKHLGLETKTVNGFSFWGLSKPARAATAKSPLEALARAFEKYSARADKAVKAASAEERETVLAAIREQAGALTQLAGGGGVMLDFYRTAGGQRFIEGTVPRLITEIARLNANLEALVEVLRQMTPVTSTTPEKV